VIGNTRFFKDSTDAAQLPGKVLVSYYNTESVTLVENALGGRIVHLNDASVKAVDYINHHPKYEDVSSVFSGAANIKHGPPTKPHPK